MATRKYIPIPGTQTHELPPLLVHSVSSGTALDEVVEAAADIVESEDLLAASPENEIDWEQRKFDLALSLAAQYRSLLSHWQWGDSILDWIRQCEITFESRETLRHLLHPDVWPHANRSSFVTLLLEKHVATGGVEVEKAVGMRLTFRQPPPIDCFSNQFLFFLNSPVAGTAYHTWARLNPDKSGLLPPERFHFDIVDLE